MYLYIELWKARPKWLALSLQERTDYLLKAGHSIQSILDEVGVDFFSVLNDPDISHQIDYRYINLWKMPNRALVRQLEEAVEQAGWHRYFEQVNAGGEIVSLEAIFGEVLNRKS